MSVQCGLVSKEFRSLYKGIDLWAKKNSTKEIFNNPFVDEKEAIVDLEDFEALLIMRERTPMT